MTNYWIKINKYVKFALFFDSIYFFLLIKILIFINLIKLIKAIN